MPYQFGPDSPFYDALEGDPQGQRANYFGHLENRQFKSPNQKDFFKSQFQAIQDKYSGLVGQYTLGGGQGKGPELTGFLDEYFGNGGGAEDDWFNMSPRQRGTQQGRFSPSVQWNVNGGPQF